MKIINERLRIHAAKDDEGVFGPIAKSKTAIDRTVNSSKKESGHKSFLRPQYTEPANLKQVCKRSLKALTDGQGNDLPWRGFGFRNVTKSCHLSLEVTDITKDCKSKSP